VREESDGIVRMIGLAGRKGFVIYSRLQAENVEHAVKAQIARFEQVGQDFEWKAYAHDTPADLRERLARYGFQPGEPEAVMVLDVEAAPALLTGPADPRIERIPTPAGLAEVRAVEEAVWGDDYSWVIQELTDELTGHPDLLSVYVARMDGVPASCAWIRFHEGTAFASLWGGSTLERFRGQGLYTSLLATRVREARRRGFRYVTVDASPMSRPILQKHGFELLTWAWACIWHAGAVPPAG
jgi:GNAT superfamily N-acetyltransferase